MKQLIIPALLSLLIVGCSSTPDAPEQGGAPVEGRGAGVATVTAGGANGSNLPAILTDSNKDESPSFAPNGRMILIATEIGGRGVLSAVSTDGRIKQRLSISAGDVREPAWGPFTK